MVHPRASRAFTQAAVVAVLLLTIVAPVSGASPDVSVITTATPTSVTVGHAIGYVVNVANDGGTTLNHVTLEGEMQTAAGTATSLFAYLGAYAGDVPAVQCSQPPATAAFCDLGQLAARTAAPMITFYYRAPAAPNSGIYRFVPTARVGEGGNDSGNASHVDTFPNPPQPIVTEVLAENQDFARGHAIQDLRTFTTGLTTVGALNPHGTTVRLPSANAEVTVADLDPLDPAVVCPEAIEDTCFGWGSALSVPYDGPVPGGIEVTMRWDYTELPSGMTAKKLRVAHLLGNGEFVQVKGMCSDGAPMPCFTVAPHKLADRDIQATFLLPSNRVTRGY